MNCKPGDLAILLRCSNPITKKFVGQIHRVKEIAPDRMFGPHWRFDPPLFNPETGKNVAWADKNLRPLRSQSGKDETLQWAPVPGQKAKEPA